MNRRIHPNGYIIGGAHDRGLRYAASGRVAGLEYFKNQIALGNIKLERKGKKIRFKVKRSPQIPWGAPDELALMRSQHFLRLRQNKWYTEVEFQQEFSGIFDSLVNAFKS